MKKLIAMTASLLLTISLLTACDVTPNDDNGTTTTTTKSTTTAITTTTAA